MKKFILPIIIIGLALVTYYVFNKKPKLTNTDASIIIKDVNTIGKIFLAQPNGETIKAIKQPNGKWLVNNTYIASQSALDNIFDVVTNAHATQPLPKSYHNTIVKNLGATGLKVELYDNDNNKIETFTVGQLLPKNVGNVIYKEGATEPYIYKIPFFDSDLSKNFFTTIKDWRTKEVMSFKLNEIKSLCMFYTKHADTSFTITKANNSYIVTDNKGNKLNHSITKVEDFLRKFEHLNCAYYLDGIIDADLIKKSKLSYGFIATQTVNNDIDTLRLAYYEADKRTKDYITINGKDYDEAYMYAWNKKDVFMIPTSLYTQILISKNGIINP